MTPEQRNFEAALCERLAERSRALIGADKRVLALLRAARQSIVEQLAAQPGEWQQWHLTRLREQIEQVLNATGEQTAAVADSALRELWQQGEDIVDKPLASAGLTAVEMQLGTLDAHVLAAMRSFAVERIGNVTAEAAARIARHIGLVTIGGATPWQAIQAVQKILGEDAPRRATTIVRTEAGRAFALASLERLRDAARLVPGLKKQWRRSGKIHSRWQHDLIDGQVQDVHQPFKVSNPDGGVDEMQCPHDPSAPAGQVINCGCVLLPFRQDWQVAHPGARPFSALELERRPGLQYMDKQARAAGLRPQPLPFFEQAHIPAAKLADYALNPDHPIGGHKARVIAAALGYTRQDAQALAQAIRQGLPHATASAPKPGPHGIKYEVDLPLQGPRGSATLRTCWIIDTGTNIPRLTSAYIPRKPRPPQTP